MRRRVWWSLALLAALAVGAALADLRQTAVSYPASAAPLVENSAWTFLERLEHASISMAPMETTSTGRMDAAEAEAAARTILSQMEESGVLTAGGQWRCIKENFYFLIGRKGAAVTGAEELGGFYGWVCTFSDEAGDCIGLLVDDETGRLLAAGFFRGDSAESDWDSEGEPMEDALAFAAFCEESYGLDLRTVHMLEEERYELLFADAAGQNLTLYWEGDAYSFKFQAMVPFL